MHFKISSAICFNLDQSKIPLPGNGLTLYHTIPTLKKKPLENIVGKGENAGNQHSLFIPQGFLPSQRQKSSFELHLFCHLQMQTLLTLYHTIPTFNNPEKEAF